MPESPGRSLSERQSREGTLTRLGRSGLASFLRLVPSRQTLGEVLWDWKGLVGDRLIRQVATWVGVDDSLFLAGVSRRIEDSPLPREAWASLQTTLAVGVEQGWDDARLHREIVKALDARTGAVDLDLTPRGMPWNALVERVARTEATAAYGLSTLQRLAREGFAAKRWVSRRDEHTRPSHLEADGQTVPLGQTFVVGGEALMVPGDPMGTPSQTYSCRCVIVGVP